MNIQRTQQTMKARYDRSACEPKFMLGDRVWVYTVLIMGKLTVPCGTGFPSRGMGHFSRETGFLRDKKFIPQDRFSVPRDEFSLYAIKITSM